jgi:hypothetical protein
MYCRPIIFDIAVSSDASPALSVQSKMKPAKTYNKPVRELKTCRVTLVLLLPLSGLFQLC